MREIVAEQLAPGDLFYDATWSAKYGEWVADSRGSRTRVDTIERCTRVGASPVHVNGSRCYDAGAPLFRIN